jgi:hypothetical protein
MEEQYEDDNNTKQSQMISERMDNLQDSYNTILLRLDPTPTLMEIRRLLLRKTEYISTTESWVAPKVNVKTVDKETGIVTYKKAPIKPMLDEEGVEELLLMLRARMSVDKVLSKLTDDRIKMIVRGVGERTIEFIYYTNKKYNINESDFDGILWIIVHNVDIFLRRAIGGTENELLNKSLTHREIMTKNTKDGDNNEKSQGGGFLGFGGRK